MQGSHSYNLQPAHGQAARPPISARHRSGSGNAITELRHHSQVQRQMSACTVLVGLFGSQQRVSAISLTGRSRGRPQVRIASARPSAAPLN
jgi:hypothetical protein